MFRRDDGFDPDLAGDGGLPLATAVPLWGTFSLLGWLTLAQAALHLVRLSS